MPTPHFRPVLAILIGVAHFVTFITIFALAFGMGDGGGTVPRAMHVVIDVLGVPLMYADPSKFAYARRFVDDAVILMTLAFLNSIIWGVAVAWLISVARRRLTSKKLV